MGSSSRLRRFARGQAPALLALLLGLAGCATGRLLEVGRVAESVLRYRSISVEGETVRVDYTVERRGRWLLHSRGERLARFALAALGAPEQIPVDAFPVEIRPLRRAPTVSLPELRIRAGASLRAVAECDGPLVLVVESEDERDAGFRLDRAGGRSCLHPFHSAALYRERTAWWVQPLLPVAFAVDLALLPVQIATLGPFLLLSE